MKRTMVGAVAVVLVAFGVLAMVTAYALNNRDKPRVGSGGSSSNGETFVGKNDWRDVEWIEEFTLTERSGQDFHSKDLDGEVWVASFFFSSCPASCKQQNDHVYRLHKKWGPRGVKFVSITCDPETDTPEVLRNYAHRFEADDQDWLFLTGELPDVRRIGGEVFGVHVQKGVHMDRFTAVDRWGKVRGHFDWHQPDKLVELEASLEKLLAEKEPPAEEPPKQPLVEDDLHESGDDEPGDDEPGDSDAASADDKPDAANPKSDSSPADLKQPSKSNQ